MKALALLRAAVAATALSIAGCSLDIFDVEVHLDTQTYRANFGATPGNIPVVSCDPAAPVDCQIQTPLVDTAIAGLPGAISVKVGCDAATSLCYGEAETRVALTFDLLQDDDFTTNLERRAVSLVQEATLVYTVPVNTLTFRLPEIGIYAGPGGSQRETDPDVVQLSKIPAVEAGNPLTAEQKVKIDGDSPARKAIEKAIGNRDPFVLIIAVTPRVDAGDPMPGGSIEIDLQPRLIVGLR
jgi:hypothetical protein